MYVMYYLCIIYVLFMFMEKVKKKLNNKLKKKFCNILGVREYTIISKFYLICLEECP